MEPGQQLFLAKTLAEFLQAALPKGAGRDHGFGVTAQQIGEARVAQDQTIRFLVEGATVANFNGRNGNAFLKDLGGQGRQRPRLYAADIPEMAEGRREPHERAVVKGGSNKAHIR